MQKYQIIQQTIESGKSSTRPFIFFDKIHAPSSLSLRIKIQLLYQVVFQQVMSVRLKCEC